jgi:hypothetical protein
VKDRLIDPFDPSFEPIEIELGPNGELPPGFNYLDPGDIHGKGFREVVEILSGEDKPADDWPPEDVVAWFMDEKIGDDRDQASTS